MAKHEESLANRRKLLVAAGGGAVALAGTLVWRRSAVNAGPLASTTGDARRARVGVARDPAAVDKAGRIVPAATERLLDAAVRGAFGVEDAIAAWRSRFRPDDVVGIKINGLAGYGLSTHAELVDAIVAKLVRAGVRAENILVWDRADADLSRARYPIRRSGAGPLYYGTNDDYEPEPTEIGSVGGCLSRIVTRKVTAVVNVPILKDHDLAGISGAMKNFYGAIHNPNRYHDNGCNPYVADLYSHPSIRDKVRLTVFDALVPQYHGGPAYTPAHTWKLGAVLASVDPVAADTVALRIVQEKRREMGMDSLEKAGRAPGWLKRAAELGLGVGDVTRIDEVRR